MQEVDALAQDNGLDMSSMYEETLKGFKAGEIVKGKIIELRPGSIVVDIGYKSEGIISLSEFRDAASLKVGDEVEALLESKEDEEGKIVLSKEKARYLQSWKDIVENHKEGDTIQGKIIRKVRGGLIVDIGVEAFLPGSQVSLKPTKNLDQYINKELNFKILKINKSRKNVILSYREYLYRQKDEQKTKLLKDLQAGQLRKGVVKNITDFGAFVDLGGVDGLLHIADMRWGRVNHPSEMLAVGDTIEVKILNFDPRTGKISVGLKQKEPSPWENIEEKYPVGSRLKARVVNLVPYGAFVELEEGLEGLVHISEFSWTKRIETPSQLLAIGDMVEVVVLGIDKKGKRISLGIKQTEANPWVEVEKKYSVGATIEGKIKNITDYGAFIELDGGVDGLIHVSDISWTKRVGHPSEVLKKGQKLEAKVLSVDAQKQKISLGLKQLEPDPWPGIAQKYPVGADVEGSVVKVTNFGIFMKCNDDLEGLIPASEIDVDAAQSEAGRPLADTLEEHFKPGDALKARVIRVNEDERKIALSLKQTVEGV